MKLPFEDRRLKSRNEFLDDIAVSLGGYVTEKLIFNDVTTGASNDIQVATALARDMVTKYGMSDELGPVALDSFSHTNLNAGLINERSISEKTFSEIDKEVSKIMNEAKKRAEDVIVKHKTALDNLADELMKMETLEREDFEKLLIVNGIKPKSEPEKEVEVFAPDSVRGE